MLAKFIFRALRVLPSIDGKRVYVCERVERVSFGTESGDAYERDAWPVWWEIEH